MNLYTTLQEKLSARCPGLEVRAEEPMFRHTSFRIGGPARLMALPKSEEEAIAAVECAAQLGIEPFFMGNGSNLLVSDEGYDGFIVKAVGGLDTLERVGETGIRVGSGVLLSRLAVFARENALTGLEFAHGIPGSVGGAVTMNAGAYGGEMKDVVVSTRVLDRDGRVETVAGEAQDFSYRHSAFSDEKRLILSAELQLQPGDPGAIQAQMDALGQRRRFKQPLDVPSAGSTFKRPEGYYAAALIDECGLKGVSVGGAQVSIRHAGFVVNQGNATCADVLALVERVRETVLRETGVTLELEVRTLGV
ncbi:UDP-N-acetylmuramate dehydrogenase [Pseudoflavonifractor phocaeensis]|uniref:UDP-N-acetylmuramate dehydrogenase n=1 Tax=Pseudoflavonifractor phocaeensis TaxID=1870988 RepID=UPI0019573189|nr:UDP-N-acetylmuramate dehydrogenase [Pseudoflavonifractor phocaeensis]MBM6869334.1 UDP-N-acetylmuramate dehydrogenase [Pseudoflavonifractor phocaeensis]